MMSDRTWDRIRDVSRQHNSRFAAALFERSAVTKAGAHTRAGGALDRVCDAFGMAAIWGYAAWRSSAMCFVAWPLGLAVSGFDIGRGVVRLGLHAVLPSRCIAPVLTVERPALYVVSVERAQSPAAARRRFCAMRQAGAGGAHRAAVRGVGGNRQTLFKV